MTLRGSAIWYLPANKRSEGAGARTLDLRIKSPLLYQLSYALKVLHRFALRRKYADIMAPFAIR